jgi:hypothetical protein
LYTLVLDLHHTSLYISNPLNPATTNLYKGSKSYGSNCYGFITCYDYQTIEFIIQVFQSSPIDTMTLLLGGFNCNVDMLFILLDKDYIARSVVVNMSWCRRMWSIASRAHMIAVTGVYYSVLGGAYCSLGKSNAKYVSNKILLIIFIK